jgi:hypothetical protein
MRLRTLALVAGLYLSTLPMMADTVYSYTGKHYTSASLPYTTADSIIGSLTISAPLGDNLTLAAVNPSAFSFSDGVETFNGGNTPTSTFLFSTDASGNISGWLVAFIDSSGDELSSIKIGGTTDSVLNNVGGASNVGDPGVWSATVVPKPSSLALMGTGVLGLVGVGRRRLGRG